MKLFQKGTKTRLVPDNEAELVASWGWEEVNPAPTSSKATVTATPAVVSNTKEEATDDLNKGENYDSDSWK